MTDPEHVEFVRWRIAEALGLRYPSMRSVMVMTPEKLDAAAEAALAAALGYDDPDRIPPCAPS